MGENTDYNYYLNKYLDGFGELKHLFFAENPLSLLTYFYYDQIDNKPSPYFSSVYEGIIGKPLQDGNRAQHLQTLKEHGVLVWDIFHHGKKPYHETSTESCQICAELQPGVPISSMLRSAMISNGCTMHAFHSSLLRLNELKLISSRDLKVYFLMPQLTSLPIFNHYNNDDFENNLESININGIDVTGKLKVLNEVYIKDHPLEIFPRHLINVIGGSNTPRAGLIAHSKLTQVSTC